MVTRRARIYRARELCCLDVDTLRWLRKRAEKGMKPEFIFPTFRLNDSYLCSLHVRAISQKRDDHQICLSLYLGTLLWLSNVSVTLASNLNLSWLIEPVIEFSFKKRTAKMKCLPLKWRLCVWVSFQMRNKIKTDEHGPSENAQSLGHAAYLATQGVLAPTPRMVFQASKLFFGRPEKSHRDESEWEELSVCWASLLTAAVSCWSVSQSRIRVHSPIPKGMKRFFLSLNKSR